MSEYIFIPPKETGSAPLVLLHGSDGRETDLLALAERLSPSAAKISIRGPVTTHGGYAFFQRFADRRIDEQDLASRVLPLSACIETALSGHGLRQRPIAVGFSSGAIMAAAALQTQPELFSGACLFRALPPFQSPPRTELRGLPVLVLDGAADARRTPRDGRVLADSLRQVGADVQHQVVHRSALSAVDRSLAMARAGT